MIFIIYKIIGDALYNHSIKVSKCHVDITVTYGKTSKNTIISTGDLMKVLLVGSGAREHALFWKLSHSELVSDLTVWPGGSSMVGANVADLACDASWDDLANWAKNTQHDFVVVGPEKPLDEGFADACNKLGVPTFGPEKLGSARSLKSLFQRGHERGRCANS